MATKRWMLDYALDTSQAASSGTSHFQHYIAGPFLSHELAERTLVALANNPAFRGGDIRLVREDA